MRKQSDGMTAGAETTSPACAAGQATGSKARDETFAFESRGWSSHPGECAPKIAALASLASLAPAEPVAKVGYKSRGNLLIVAGTFAEPARAAARELASTLHVTMLSDASPAAGDGFTALAGSVESLVGYLGEFTATVAGLRSTAAPAKFDLVLDFSAQPLFAMRQPPQGYYRAPADTSALAATMAELREAVGEFEKPRYFHYRENLCAHSRSEIEGCNACIEICSTEAISADGDHVRVDPHLCMGCGACSTVCPSGAMGYQ